MPKTLADSRIKLVALTSAPANPLAPTDVELKAGVDLSCRINKGDYRLSATGSDTVPDQELCAEGNAVTFGASNYEGSLTPFRYLTDEGKADESNDVAWDTLAEKGTELWLYERVGPKHSVDWAVADVVDHYHVITDNPQAPSDLTGYIKRVVPLGVQDAAFGLAVVGTGD